MSNPFGNSPHAGKPLAHFLAVDWEVDHPKAWRAALSLCSGDREQAHRHCAETQHVMYGDYVPPPRPIESPEAAAAGKEKMHNIVLGFCRVARWDQRRFIRMLRRPNGQAARFGNIKKSVLVDAWRGFKHHARTYGCDRAHGGDSHA